MINNDIDRNVGRNDFTDSVKSYYQELKRYSPIPQKIERELLIKAKNGDIKARNQIITANLRFVFDIAKKYRGNGVDIADLISEGNTGIIRAIEKFDLSQNVKFYTYASWWIRQRMIAAIDERMFENKNETNFDDEFPAENQNIENISKQDDDCDDCFYYEEKDVGDFDDYSFESKEECDQKRFVVNKLLSGLDERERIIVMKYFGIDDNGDGKSLEEISSDLNISTEGVRQIKIKAINKMRAEVFTISQAEFLFK